MSVKTIKLRDWTRFPGGRFKEDGEFSGEEFRQEFLSEELEYCIDFNGVFTVGWSFLDESLGHIASQIGEDKFRKRFTFIADDDPDILSEIDTVIKGRMSA